MKNFVTLFKKQFRSQKLRSNSLHGMCLCTSSDKLTVRNKKYQTIYKTSVKNHTKCSTVCEINIDLEKYNMLCL